MGREKVRNGGERRGTEENDFNFKSKRRGIVLLMSQHKDPIWNSGSFDLGENTEVIDLSADGLGCQPFIK